MTDYIEENPVHLAHQKRFDRKITREKKIKKRSATKDFGKAKKSLKRHLVERYYRGQGSGG